jgi:PAS domain S-box-containing protein
MDPVDAGIFEAWLASTDDGVVAVDAEGRVVLHNPAASRVTGLPPAAARRRPWREVLRLDSAVGDLLWSAGVTGRPAGTLASVLCAQGNLRTAETHAHPWTDATGRTGILVLIRDLTVLCRNRSGPGGRNGYGGLVGADPLMTALYDLIEAIAPSDAPAVIEGEPGTGKELVAQTIHQLSPRTQMPFVPINCAAIPNELMEAELFGYARGAFSGAVQRYDGQLMAAESGTVFLDEIDDTSLETQVKLLRVLEDHVVSRLGENAWHQVDFRMIAATNRDLRRLVEAGGFGIDLYERLAIVTIQLPPLRARLEDLPALVDHFLSKFAKEQGQPRLDGIRADALRALGAYPWPGNIRELRNVIYETLVYKRAGRAIIPSDLPRRILRRGTGERDAQSVDRAALAQRIEAGTMNLAREVAALQRAAIDEALSRTGGNAAAAARLLGAVGRGSARDPGGTLRAMMRRLRARGV